MKRTIDIACTLAVSALFIGLTACSTTKRLAEGDILYTGVRKMNVEMMNGDKVNPDVQDAVKDPLNVKPNNPLYSPYIRTPFPVGLWFWNNSKEGSWWYRNFAKQPVLIQDVKPNLRVGMVEDILDNHGYFGSVARYEQIEQKNPKKARISYDVRIADPWYYGTVEFPRGEIDGERRAARIAGGRFVYDDADSTSADSSARAMRAVSRMDTLALNAQIDSLGASREQDSLFVRRQQILTHGERRVTVERMIGRMQESSNVREGRQYNIDTLTRERVRITNALREQGYYYFRPDYLEYLADTTRERYKVDLRMVMAQGTPEEAVKPYNIGDIGISLHSATGTGEPDTTNYNGINIWYQQPLKIRPKVMARAITIAPGQPARVSDINTTLTNLTRLGVFRYVNMNVTPLDSLAGRNTIDMEIDAAFDAPLQAELEVDFTSKSNSFIGPGVIFSVNNKNIFHGGEVLSVKLNGAYEWQTGNKNSGANAMSLNSYEFGVNGSLMFPRLLASRFITRDALYGGRTTFNVGATLMNRPQFFRMISFNLTPSYDFQTSPRSFHNLTLLKFVYNRMLSTTADFDQTMAENQAIALSFQNQLIPSASYTYTYDRGTGRGNRNRLVWQSTVTTAGNILAGAFSVLDKESDQKIFGNPFSQFVKGVTDFKYYWQLDRNNQIATRLTIGAAHPYGKFVSLPYNEQFYIGGANSIRAFTIRTVGPGSYVPPEDKDLKFLDQTGEFKFELNIEYRFNIMGGLKGAVFFDAGNIWLLSDDPDRPGGLLRGQNFFKELATGTGVGVRYDLTFLVLRFDMGIGLHTPYENPDKKGYINVGRFRDALGFHLAIGYPF